jgi:uroporphyrinogen-III decarboxylase
MNPDLSKKTTDKITAKIEALCEQGCSQVNQLLEKSANGNDIEELSEFSTSEINQIIDELSQIMSVYKSDKTDNDTGFK